MNRRILLAITLLLTGGALERVAACTCGEATTAQYFQSATAVFIGVVGAKQKSNAVAKDGVEVTFRVEGVWKGNVSKKALVYTGPTGDLYPFENMCAPQFRVGRRYIVFALGRDKLETDICTGTVDSRYGRNVTKQLGRARPPARARE